MSDSPPPLQWHELANLATLLEESLKHYPHHTGVTAHMLKRIRELEKAEWARKEREREAEKSGTRNGRADTTAIRAFAEGMRCSVGIRDELLSARSHLLALCDALDAERAANAEMRRALDAAARALETASRDRGEEEADVLDDLRQWAWAVSRASQASEALRAAEKAPETPEKEDMTEKPDPTRWGVWCTPIHEKTTQWPEHWWGQFWSTADRVPLGDAREYDGAGAIAEADRQTRIDKDRAWRYEARPILTAAPETTEPAPPRWRVGRTLGRTLYRDDRVVGLVDTPELAAEIVAAANRTPPETP